MAKHPFSEAEIDAGCNEAISFLQTRPSAARWHLFAIDPDSGKVEGATFARDQAAEARAWIKVRQGEKGMYYHVNPPRADFKGTKASKDDIASAIALHVDIDNTTDDRAVMEYSPKPSIVVQSGGGLHAYWPLDTPTTELKRVEASNRVIAQRLGGDNCHNIDRIMRLPGTINVPSAKKRAAGRVPVFARVIYADWTQTHSLEDFPVSDPDTESKTPSPTAGALAIVPVDLTALPDAVSPATRRIIESGDDDERPRGSDAARFPSRSEAVFFVACDLARTGVPVEAIAGILINPALRISESILERKDAKRYALRQAAAGAAAATDGWPDPDKKGSPRATMRNALVALRRIGLSFRFDRFRERKMIDGTALEEHQGEISDDAVMVLRGLIINGFGFDPRSDHVRDAVNLLCLEHAFHPIREELDALVWDGVERLDRWMPSYLGAEDAPLNAAIGRILLIAAVRRIRQPGVKFDQIVVLEGAQGSGKSTAVRILAGPGNHSDQEILTLDAKAQVEMLEGVWFYELGEVEGMNRAEVNKIKAFASRQVDRARPAYAHFAVSRPRQAVFIGTTNDDKYLRDQTGNRRFWPVRTGTIDLEGLARDRDQLLAEAAHREAAGESIELPKELWEAAAEQQAERLEADPWAADIARVRGQLFGDVYRITTSSILDDELRIPPGQQNQSHGKRLAPLMAAFGWRPAKFKISGQTVRGYERPAELDPGDEAFAHKPKPIT